MSRAWMLALALACIAAEEEAAAAPRTAVPAAAAESGDAPAQAPAVSGVRRWAAISAAVVPGIVIRGTGSYLVKEPVAARRLMWTGAIGGAGMLVGGLVVGLTGGNQYSILPGVPILVAGTGLFMTSWLSDLWVTAGGPRIDGHPRAPVPWAVEVGAAWLRDPAHPRGLAVVGARAALARAELAGLAWLHRDAIEGLLDVRVRVLGAAPTGDVVGDGTRFVVRGGVRMRRDTVEHVRVWTPELEAIGRLDLRRLTAAAGGAFLELGVGLGVERVRYAGEVSDSSSILLGRFAWGVYLGRAGEATLFYDHRRDHLAGGIAAGRAAGFVGSAGAAVDVRIAGPWAARAELEFGSAWVMTAALRFQGGAR